MGKSKPKCGNCEFFRRADKFATYGQCHHEIVKQIDMENRGYLPGRGIGKKPCAYYQLTHHSK